MLQTKRTQKIIVIKQIAQRIIVNILLIIIVSCKVNDNSINLSDFINTEVLLNQFEAKNYYAKKTNNVYSIYINESKLKDSNLLDCYSNITILKFFKSFIRKKTEMNTNSTFILKVSGVHNLKKEYSLYELSKINHAYKKILKFIGNYNNYKKNTDFIYSSECTEANKEKLSLKNKLQLFCFYYQKDTKYCNEKIDLLVFAFKQKNLNSQIIIPYVLDSNKILFFKKYQLE